MRLLSAFLMKLKEKLKENFIRYSLLVSRPSLAFRTDLILCVTDLTRRWKHSSVISVHILPLQILWGCVNCSISFLSCLTRVTPGVVFCPSSLAFDLSIQRCSFVYFGYNESLFELLLSAWNSRAILIWPLVLTTECSSERSLTLTILCKPYRLMCVKVPLEHQFLNYSDYRCTFKIT